MTKKDKIFSALICDCLRFIELSVDPKVGAAIQQEFLNSAQWHLHLMLLISQDHVNEKTLQKFYQHLRKREQEQQQKTYEDFWKKIKAHLTDN